MTKNIMIQSRSLSLATNREVLFVARGIQTDLSDEQFVVEPIDEMVVPNMLHSEKVVDVDILGYSTPESTPDPEPISLD
jgi:hypothetical protein